MKLWKSFYPFSVHEIKCNNNDNFIDNNNNNNNSNNNNKNDNNNSLWPSLSQDMSKETVAQLEE